MTKDDKLVRSLKTQTEAGLTLVEVIVAMLVASLCLGTALQGYVAAVSVKARTKHLSKAIDEINADAEAIRQMAQGSIGSCGGDYAQTLMNKVVEQDEAKQGQAEQTVVAQATPAPDQGGAELNPQSNDEEDHHHHHYQSGNAPETSGTASLPSTSDEPGASSPDNSGDGPSQDNSGDGPSQSKPYFIASKDLPSSYKLKREMNIDPNTSKVLKVSYHLTRSAESSTVEPDSPTSAAPADEMTDKPLAQLSLSIMPSDALRCP